MLARYDSACQSGTSQGTPRSVPKLCDGVVTCTMCTCEPSQCGICKPAEMMQMQVEAETRPPKLLTVTHREMLCGSKHTTDFFPAWGQSFYTNLSIHALPTPVSVL